MRRLSLNSLLLDLCLMAPTTCVSGSHDENTVQAGPAKRTLQRIDDVHCCSLVLTQAFPALPHTLWLVGTAMTESAW